MLKQYKIKQTENEIEIQIVYSGRKSMAIEVKKDGTCIARLPKGVPDHIAIAFFEKQADWIFRKSKQMKEQKKQNPDARIPKWDSLTKEMRTVIKYETEYKVKQWSEKMGGISYQNVSVKNQKTRWGSCSVQGNLNFNYRLYFLPESLFDYVVVHELAHRRHMDHSKKFWEEVAAYLPEYRVLRQQLKEIQIGE